MTFLLLKNKLTESKIFITKTGIFLFIYTLILGSPFALVIYGKNMLLNIFGDHWLMFPLGLMGLMATSGPYVYIYIKQKAEERLLKDQKQYQDTLTHASIGMTRIRDLDKLLNLIVHILSKTVHLSYTAIYLKDNINSKYVLHAQRPKNSQTNIELEFSSALITYIEKTRQPLIYEELKRMSRNNEDSSVCNSVTNQMHQISATLIIPSMLEDKFVGLLVLGKKISGQNYTSDDLDVFQILASQGALAIENAQFYKEAQEMQSQIAQAEKMATIGTMADGLSHQINNRFHAISMISGDALDTIKTTDLSSCSKDTITAIEEINYALGRIQSNVMQGGEIVKGLLKYSRREEGLEAISLPVLLDNTLEMVQYKVKLSEIDFQRNFGGELPLINGNMTQLEEVLFNCIDNAYEAILERKLLLKETGYNGKITIDAAASSNTTNSETFLTIIIKDNGIGIKPENLKRLFTPFFTTKNTIRKGTGLGLYVIKRIITELHRGRINLESTYGTGSTFSIELPAITNSV